MKRGLILTILVAAGVSAQAVTFTNVIINSAPFNTGASYSVSGNSISFFTPNAVIDEGQPAVSTIIQIQYDADAGAGNAFSSIYANIGAVQLGAGLVSFLERAYELDSNGNEVGGVIASISNPTFASNFNFSGSDALVRQVQRIRVKKDIVLTAPNASAARDLAALAIVNQSVQVVPEPATMTALGLGAAALLRRRKK